MNKRTLDLSRNKYFIIRKTIKRIHFCTAETNLSQQLYSGLIIKYLALYTMHLYLYQTGCTLNDLYVKHDLYLFRCLVPDGKEGNYANEVRIQYPEKYVKCVLQAILCTCYCKEFVTITIDTRLVNVEEREKCSLVCKRRPNNRNELLGCLVIDQAKIVYPSVSYKF